MQIAVTDAGGDGADQHLTAPRLVDIDRFERQRRVTLRNTAASIAIVYLPVAAAEAATPTLAPLPQQRKQDATARAVN